MSRRINIAMGRKSITILSSDHPTDSVVFVSDPVRVDQWYTSNSHIVTAAISMTDFKGRVSIEASIKWRPTEEDWFPVFLGDRLYLDFPECCGDHKTSTISYNFKGRFVWLRTRVDKTHVIPTDALPAIVASCGCVDRVLVNI